MRRSPVVRGISGSVAKFDFTGKIRKPGISNSVIYRHQNSPKSNLVTEPAFQHQYAVRSGIESTHEQAIRRCGLRRSRYIGLAKTHLQHLLTAIAINLVRLSDWWAGISPAKTRCSPFAALQWGKPAVHQI
jgi:hypothetical protein